jgi:hypothetical protein
MATLSFLVYICYLFYEGYLTHLQVSSVHKHSPNTAAVVSEESFCCIKMLCHHASSQKGYKELEFVCVLLPLYSKM